MYAFISNWELNSIADILQNMKFVLKGPIEQEVSIGQGNGSMPIRQQVITQIMKVF